MNSELRQLLDDIETHNRQVYDNTPEDEPVDFSKTKQSWGIDVIPEKFWIDISKTHRTRDGKRVINLQKILYNDYGDEVCYPIKGSIVMSEKPRKVVYTIWTLTGSFCNPDDSNLDLVEEDDI